MAKNCRECEFYPPELLTENVPFWLFFKEICTYVKRGGFGEIQSYDWGTIKAIADLMGMELTPRDFKKLKRLEWVDLEYYSKQAAKE